MPAVCKLYSPTPASSKIEVISSLAMYGFRSTLNCFAASLYDLPFVLAASVLDRFVFFASLMIVSRRTSFRAQDIGMQFPGVSSSERPLHVSHNHIKR